MSRVRNRPLNKCRSRSRFNFEYLTPEIRPIDEQLLEAVYTRSLPRVLELLREGADVNAKGHAFSVQFDTNLVTPLILASEDGSIDLVKALLERPSVDLHGVDNYGRTALHVAAEFGHADVVQLLLSAEGIDVGFKDKCGFTPLHLAALNCHGWVVGLLLQAKEIELRHEEAVDVPRTTVFLRESTEDSQQPLGAIGKLEENAVVAPKSRKKSRKKKTKKRLNDEEPKLDEKPLEEGRKTPEAIQDNPPESASLSSFYISSLLGFFKKSLITQQVKTVQVLLENVQSSGETVQESVENVQSPGEPVQESVENVQPSGETVQEPVENVQPSGEMVQESMENAARSPESSKETPKKSSKEAQKSSKTDSKDSETTVNRDNEGTQAQRLQYEAKMKGSPRFRSYRGEVLMIDMLLKGGMSTSYEEEIYFMMQHRRRVLPPDSPDRKTLKNNNVEEESVGELPELHRAAVWGDLEHVQELLADPGIDVNAKDAFGNTPLHLAAREGRLAVLSALLGASDVNARNHLGQTPLVVAAERRRHEVVAELSIRCGAVDVNAALTVAAARGSTGVVRCLLVRRRRDIDAKTAAAALHIAVVRNYPEMVGQLLKYVGGLLVDAVAPLHVAIGNGNRSMVEALVHHVYVNGKGRFDDSPLHAAIEVGCLEMVELLLKQEKVLVNIAGLHMGRSPLHLAAEKGSLDIVRALLMHPEIIVDFEDGDGNKPVDLAERNNHVDCAEALRNAKQEKDSERNKP